MGWGRGLFGSVEIRDLSGSGCNQTSHGFVVLKTGICPAGLKPEQLHTLSLPQIVPIDAKQGVFPHDEWISRIMPGQMVRHRAMQPGPSHTKQPGSCQDIQGA